ncbi:MAG: ATP-binding protein [Clostridia bacterium]|nr:ATP-binding protein [Clostridia bacterium]
MLIGRQNEVRNLREAMEKDSSQLIAVCGRWRAGKTFLIREVFQNTFTFQHSGAYNTKKETQLFLFYESLLDAGLPKSEPQPQNWFDAFALLKAVVRGSSQKKKVLFLDELSWMDTPKSDLVPALEHFWNAWASARKDIIMILCSSATSWMISRIVHNKGGLYNRLTGRIDLEPLSLAQCRQFVQVRNLGLSDSQILELYMVLGGIPFYWEQLQRGYSVAQNIDFLFFRPDAPLKEEFRHLFSSTFKRPEPYEKIVMALAGHRQGLTRNELLGMTRLTGSGTFTRYLQELESGGFICEYHGYGKKRKDGLYQLTDPFVLFHHHFVSKSTQDSHYWSNQIHTPAFDTWCGLSFELVCLLHVEQLKRGLGIQGVITDVCSFSCKADPDAGVRGSQIDLMLDRADRVINLVEIKYTQGELTITKSMAEEIRTKRSDFRTVTRSKSAIHITIVTPFGLKWNSYAGEVQSQLTLENLFED